MATGRGNEAALSPCDQWRRHDPFKVASGNAPWQWSVGEVVHQLAAFGAQVPRLNSQSPSLASEQDAPLKRGSRLGGPWQEWHRRDDTSLSIACEQLTMLRAARPPTASG